jgi:hypothetical protein
MRLKAMAALRPPTIATTIQKTWCHVGQPCAASSAPINANGRAKTECSKRIIRNVKRSGRGQG